MINELVTALENLQEAKAQYKEAAKSCKYDKDFFLYREINTVEEAEKSLAAIFDNAVRKVVIDVIKNKEHLIY